MKFISKYLLLVILSLNFCFALAQEDGGRQLRNRRKNPIVKTRIGISPVIGLYKPNKNHTSGAKQKMAFNISIKEEIRLDKKNRCFLMVGAEYVLHGVSFNSYYFYEDSLHLYNGKMNARYGLTIQELDIPIQLKYSLQPETNTIVSSYLFAGYCSRWLLANKLKVANNGQEVFAKPVNLKFKLPGFSSSNSSFLSFGFGAQRNTQLRHNAVFAELQFRYSLSPIYFEESFAPTSMYINNHFFLLTVGFKL